MHSLDLAFWQISIALENYLAFSNGYHLIKRIQLKLGLLFIIYKDSVRHDRKSFEISALLSWKLRYPKRKNSNNSYFLHWNFDWKSCFVVFFLKWNEWKNPQFNFSSQYLSIEERNFFKWDEKETKIWHLLFHRIRKKEFSLVSPLFF